MYLLDVNTLLALAWDDHPAHDSVHRWFQENAARRFSTCHVTQSGFVRLSLNPAVVHCQISAREALLKLLSITSHSAHTFVEDGPVQTSAGLWDSVVGHQLVTDVNLLLIARRHGKSLVTCDATFRNWLAAPQREFVTPVPA